MQSSAIIGTLLGTAVGDALGLPYENLSRRRGACLWGEPDRYHFLFGRGMTSDDTEHTCMVAQSLIVSAGQPERFARDFGHRLRWWLLGLPAGIGRATLLGCVDLWLGFGPHRSGIFSAGNGPAMRAAVLGAAVDDPPLLRTLVRTVTRVTHTDPKAEHGALVVALAASLARSQPGIDGRFFLEGLRKWLPEGSAAKLLALIEQAVQSVAAGKTTPEFADAQGWSRKVTGFVNQTVPVAVHAWLRHPRDFRAAVTEAIRCGGDTDTTAAIVGGIVGAAVGKEGIPLEWLGNLAEWPRTVAWLERLGERLAEVMRSGQPGEALPVPVAGLFVRNLFFFLVVLAHVFRRWLPPY
jgi:ADP-ribosylglycohydrolase